MLKNTNKKWNIQ